MSVLQLTDEQVLSLFEQLPSPTKRAALLALASKAEVSRDERMTYAENQLRQRARERGNSRRFDSRIGRTTDCFNET